VHVLKKSRWLLLKREENLKTEQRFPLRDLLRYNLKTVRAYLLKEAFQQLWDYNSPAWAGKFLDDWCRQVMRSRIEPMKKIARSLRQHRELILNYFRAQKLLSSGVVEGLNNKAKVTMRKSYGFRTFRCLELALYHSLGKLPEPESTHRFLRRGVKLGPGRLVSDSPHSELSHPASFIRWRAGNNDPSFTRNVSCVTCAIRHRLPSSCMGSRATTFRIRTSGVPCGRAVQEGGRLPMSPELCCKSSADTWIAAIGRATLGQAAHALRGKRESRRQPGPPLSAVRRRRRTSPGPSR